jgi:hypothetical protein
MTRNRKTAILIGVLYITGTAAGMLSVAITTPIRNAQDLLTYINGNEIQVIIGALLILLMGLALAMVPVMMFPISRKHNETLAIGYVVFRGALETICYMAMAIGWLLLLPLSQVYIQAGATEASTYHDIGAILLNGEAIAFLTTIVFIIGAVMFYAVLFQSRLIPRWISIWGLAAAIPYLLACFLVMFGLVDKMSSLDSILQLPLFLQEMVLALWLIVRGFNSPALFDESTEPKAIGVQLSPSRKPLRSA